MPVYEYSCSKCNLNLELTLLMKDRDNLSEIRKKYCKLKSDMKENSLPDINFLEPPKCKLKREVSKGTTFKI